MKNRKLFGFVLTAVLVFFMSGSPLFAIDTTSTEANRGGSVVIPPAYFNNTGGVNSSVAYVTTKDQGVNNLIFKDPYNPNATIKTWGGSFNGRMNNQVTKFFCIDIRNPLVLNQNNPPQYIDNGFTPSEITYILMNYYPYRSYPYSGSINPISKEAAAVQMAVWHFSDGVDVSTLTGNNDIKNRALQIISDANANAAGFVPVKTLIIIPENQNLISGETAKFRVRVFDERAKPVANKQIRLSVNAGTLSTVVTTTGPNGITPDIELRPGNATNITVTAQADVIIPQGTRFVHATLPDRYQKLVLATPVSAQRSAMCDFYWTSQVDLSLTKIVDNENPQNGDNITFTVTASNAGPANATGVIVTDFMPGGVTYVSHQASRGTYFPINGTWRIGNIANGESVTLTVTVKVDIAQNYLFDLGPATGFNVFTLEDMNQPTADVQGKVAVGQDGFFSNFSVGDELPQSGGQTDVLVVGRHLTFASGNVVGGNIVYGATGTISQMVGIPDGTARQDSVIDFQAAAAYLSALSAQLAGYNANGNISLSGVTLRLMGSDPYMNVFRVPADFLNTSQEIFINVPNGSVVLVNIDGDNLSWGGNLIVSGTPITNCMFNFNEAKNITIQGIDVTGTILAPSADVNFISGVQHGQMICKSLSGGAQYNLANFVGNIALDTTLVNVAEVTACNEVDGDSSPNNGAQYEDDFAMCKFTVRGTNSGGGGGGAVIGNWQYIGSVSDEHFIWSFIRAQDGSFIAGTWGGKILRTTDEGHTFTVLNEGMQVSYIWDVIQAPDGRFFAATERGIYTSNDNGATWSATAMPEYDVRSLVLRGNYLYAGIWGQGVYRSPDNGATWEDVSNGMTNKSVQAIAVDGNGNLYSGTFGGGVYKSVDGGANWVQTSMNFPFVWSLAVTNSGIVAAGTYGNGLYLSANGGDTWQVQTQGIMATHIYYITAEADNYIFVNSWSNGIYLAEVVATESTDLNWVSIGLTGQKISTLLYNQADGSLFATTTNGGVFRNDAPTSLKGLAGLEIPKEFNLSNNYPNPFNPSTVIEFSLPVAEKVELVVYNMLGEVVAKLVSGELPAGTHKVNFNASNLASGIYLYRITAGNNVVTKKMILQK